jgi:GTP cyclohydrolase I
LNGDFVADRNPISHGKIYNDMEDDNGFDLVTEKDIRLNSLCFHGFFISLY